MRTFHYNRAFAGVVTRLCTNPHTVTHQPVFATLRDLLCFAAALGFEEQCRVSLEGDQDDFVDGRVFSNHQPSLDLLYLVALASKRDMNVLRDENESEMVDIFEEFANGGLQILNDWLHASPADMNGDRAILKALQSSGYLASRDNVKSLDDVLGDLSF